MCILIIRGTYWLLCSDPGILDYDGCRVPYFQGLWTDGRVSRAMWSAGAGALGGVSVADGALSLLGRRGVLRVRPRDVPNRARALFYSGRQLQAANLLCAARGPRALKMSQEFINYISERPTLMTNKEMAKRIISLCVKFELRYVLSNYDKILFT